MYGIISKKKKYLSIKFLRGEREIRDKLFKPKILVALKGAVNFSYHFLKTKKANMNLNAQ